MGLLLCSPSVCKRGVLAPDTNAEVFEGMQRGRGQARAGGPDKLQRRGNQGEIPLEAERL